MRSATATAATTATACAGPLFSFGLRTWSLGRLFAGKAPFVCFGNGRRVAGRFFSPFGARFDDRQILAVV